MTHSCPKNHGTVSTGFHASTDCLEQIYDTVETITEPFSSFKLTSAINYILRMKGSHKLLKDFTRNTLHSVAPVCSEESYFLLHNINLWAKVVNNTRHIEM